MTENMRNTAREELSEEAAEAAVAREMKSAPPPKKEGVASNYIEEAKAAAERLEAANIEAAALHKKILAANHEASLGGSASAGKSPEVKKSDEEQKQENAKAMLEGTGFENMMD